MKYLIKSKMPYPNSFIINKERIVFMAHEEKVLSTNVAAQYPDYLTLLEEIKDIVPENIVPVIEVKQQQVLITEPNNILNDIVEKKEEEVKQQVLITEPNLSVETMIKESKKIKKAKKVKKTKKVY